DDDVRIVRLTLQQERRDAAANGAGGRVERPCGERSGGWEFTTNRDCAARVIKPSIPESVSGCRVAGDVEGHRVRPANSCAAGWERCARRDRSRLERRNDDAFAAGSEGQYVGIRSSGGCSVLPSEVDGLLEITDEIGPGNEAKGKVAASVNCNSPGRANANDRSVDVEQQRGDVASDAGGVAEERPACDCAGAGWLQRSVDRDIDTTCAIASRARDERV